MSKVKNSEKRTWGVGNLINSVQTLFVGMLKVWTIPIVLMLSVASGFTTFYGLSHFITPWIALVITVAIQSIVVICSLEILADQEPLEPDAQKGEEITAALFFEQ